MVVSDARPEHGSQGHQLGSRHSSIVLNVSYVRSCCLGSGKPVYLSFALKQKSGGSACASKDLLRLTECHSSGASIILDLHGKPNPPSYQSPRCELWRAGDLQLTPPLTSLVTKLQAVTVRARPIKPWYVFFVLPRCRSGGDDGRGRCTATTKAAAIFRAA